MKPFDVFQKISLFVKRYSWAIMMSLFICVIAQYCTISKLRQEVDFLHQKYESYVPYKPDSTALGVAGADVLYQHADGEALIIKQTETDDATDDSSSLWIWFVVLLIFLGVGIFMLYKQGVFPFGLSISGKVWQDLNGRIIYTLQVKNSSRKSVTVCNPTIEFSNMRNSRKFRMPVADFPLTLLPSTKHSVNISLQKLIEQHQELMEFRTIRAAVECNNRLYRTFPLVVRWNQK